jgi:hypothetical protein
VSLGQDRSEDGSPRTRDSRARCPRLTVRG